MFSPLVGKGCASGTIKRWLRACVPAVATLLLLHTGKASAQTDYLTFTGVYTTLNVSGLVSPSAISGDASGNLYITDSTLTSVIKFAADGTQTTLGSGLNLPAGVAVDTAGTVYVTSNGDNKVYKITSGGTQSAVGSGWNAPTSIGVDAGANVYVTDGSGLSKVTPGGTQTVLSALPTLLGVAVDTSGDIYFGNTATDQVYKIASGTSAAVAQNYVSYPRGLWVDPGGNVYAAQTDGGVQRADDAGSDTTTFGDTTTSSGVWGDAHNNLYIADATGKIEKVALGPVDMGSVNVCPAGTTVTPCGSSQTLHFALDSYVAANMAMNALIQGYTGEDFTFTADSCSGALSFGSFCAVTVSFNPQYAGVRSGAVQAVGASYYNNVARPVAQPRVHTPVRPHDEPPNTLLSQVLLHGIGLAPLGVFNNALVESDPDYTPLPNAYPVGVTLVASDAIFVTDLNNCVVQLVNGTTTTTIAGSTCGPASGDGGPATSAVLGSPLRTVVDGAGNLYIVDSGSDTVRVVNPLTGTINAFAGTGTSGNTGDGGLASLATFEDPVALAMDAVGNLYIADAQANVVRRVDAATRIITTVAGSGTLGYSGDGGPATSAEMEGPQGLAIDGAGNLYIADLDNDAVRKVAAGTGIMTTIAGTGNNGYSGDGGPGTSAELYAPAGVSVDAAGNVYIADTSNLVVRMVSAATGIITTVAGKYNAARTPTYTGDYGSALQAGFSDIQDVQSTTYGLLIIADSSNQAIRGVIGIEGVDTFGTVALGSTSAAQDTSLTNAGNMPLVLGAPLLSADFTLGGADTTCAANVTLANGASCILGVELAPVTDGALQEAIGIPSNSLNETGYVQPLFLFGTGTGTLPALLAFAGQIAPIAPGGNLGMIAVMVEGSENTLTTATNMVTLTITGPGGYSHTVTVAAVSGVATFNLSGLPLITGGLYTLTATSPNLTSAQTTAVVSGGNPITPAQLAIPAPPPATVANGGNLGVIAVDVENYLGTLVTGATDSVTLVVTGPGGYTHSVTVTATEGVATFDLSSLSLTTPGLYTLTATSGELKQAVVTATVSAAPPEQLGIAASSIPATLASGGNLGVLAVEVLSAPGVVNTNASNLVTLTIIGPGSFDYTVTVAAGKGIASFDLSALPFTAAGVYTVSASTTGLTTLVRTFTVTIDFTLAVTGSTQGSQNIPPGSATSFNFTLAPASGSFAAPIALTASGLPAGATYTFSPAMVTPGSAAVTTQLSIQTAGPRSALLAHPPAGHPGTGQAAGLGIVAFALLLLPLSASRRMRKAFRRTPWLCLLLLLSLGTVAGLSGCGAGGLFGTPQQNYTITVTGTSGSISHSATVTLTVQ